MMTTDAVSSLCSYVEREWGSYGYRLAKIVEGPWTGSAVAEVWASDGAVFYVGADRHGESRLYDEDEERLRVRLIKERDERSLAG